MRFKFIIAAVLAILIVMPDVMLAQDHAAANALTPASVFTAKDFPEAQPGTPVWTPDPALACGVVYYDKWVYVVSQAKYILQFECDPATAKLTYKGATPLGYERQEGHPPNIFCWIRRTDDNLAKLLIFWGDHDKALSWYALDKTSGAPTLEGKQVPAKCDHHNATQLMAPDQQHFCYGGRVLDKVDWYRFGAVDGTPVVDGSIVLKNFSVGNVGMSSGCMMFSPDWKHMYYMAFQCPDDKDPKNDKTPLIDTYNIDLKTHKGTYVASLELPVAGTPQGRVSGTLEPFTPDGKFTYAIFRNGAKAYYYALSRDATSGVLTIAGQGANTNAGNLKPLTGPPWGRQDRFAYTADGQTGFFTNLGGTPNAALECFSRDLATGTLTFLPPVADIGARKLILDQTNGILFTVGEKIASFKVGGTVK